MGYKWVLFCFTLVFSYQAHSNYCSHLFLNSSPTRDADLIYEKFGINDSYPEKVIRQADKLLARGLKAIDFEGRKDLTNEGFVTIDGKETIDRDDAILVKKTQSGNFILKVAVPDVAALISPQSTIGKWYFEQSTSHYLREKVFHLLPPKLVSGLLSIDPDKTRLAMVYEVEYDVRQGRLKNFKAERAVIKSRRAYTYGEFQARIDDPNKRTASENRIIQLYQALNGTRNPNLNFPFTTEKRPITNEQGLITGFVSREDITANHLIEVFMVAVNSEGARFMVKNGIPGIFRGQEEPAERKLDNFYEILERLRIPFKFDSKKDEFENLREAFAALKTYKHPMVILPLLFYVTKLAENSTYSQGHYFLNVDAYSFLTSPLRRVSDYWNQYMMGKYLEGKLKSKEVFELLEKQEVIVESDNDNMMVAKQAENHWVGVKELGLLPAGIEGKSYKAIYVREYNENIMFYIPELKMYAFEEKFEAELPRQPFKHIGKPYDVTVKKLDLEKGQLILGIF